METPPPVSILGGGRFLLETRPRAAFPVGYARTTGAIIFRPSEAADMMAAIAVAAMDAYVIAVVVVIIHYFPFLFCTHNIFHPPRHTSSRAGGRRASIRHPNNARPLSIPGVP